MHVQRSFGWLCVPLLVAATYHVVSCVEIRRLSVPRWVQNGTDDAVVLDCDYSWNENDFRLVVKWFFEDNLEPVYQWIPELNIRHTSGVLKNRLDMDFSVNTVDAYSKFRALRIPKPSIELSGKYTCLVTSLAGQDSREQVMTVFVPASDFELTYVEGVRGLVNVTCDVFGTFPRPDVKLYLRPSSSSPPQLVQNTKKMSTSNQNGAFNVHLLRTFSVKELTKNDATVFECLLELPGTNYVRAKRIAYYPGIQGQMIGSPHGLAAAAITAILPTTIWVAFVHASVIILGIR